MKNQGITIEYLYSNGLAADRFARMLDDPTQCYKFYWLDAVMTLFPIMGNELAFDEIFNEMIYAAWYPVTKFQLRLGPMINGEPANLLERAVHIIEVDECITESVNKRDIISAIKRNSEKLKDCKNSLAKNVPYRLLSSFMDEIGGNDRIWDQKRRLIQYIIELNEHVCLPYTIIDRRGFNKKIHINIEWQKFLTDNYSVIRSWIRLKKIQFLQDRNPGVPGIIYKLEDSHEDGRKMEAARKLWKDASTASGRPIVDIYSGCILDKNSFALDHFVPWTYVANDELWNLTPIDHSLNSAKGNRLPDWNRFFKPLADNQFNLYKTIFSIPSVRTQFERCRKHNLNTIWATEMLYVENNTEERFKSILEQYMYPVYESAHLQGFKPWIVPEQ